MRSRRQKLALALGICIGCVAGASLAGCGDAATDRSEREGRPDPVVLIGLDGFEWNLALPLLARGELPNLEALMARGSYGLLATMEPTLSPIIWTSIATSKSVEQHGIRGFAKRDHPGELYTARDRRTKAVWNIASDAGLDVAVVGWWMTFPAEPVRGAMVSQTNTEAQLRESFAGGSQVMKGQLVAGVEGQVYPAERQAEAMAIYRDVDATLDARLEAIFGHFDAPLTQLGQRLWDSCRWAFRADATYVEIADRLLGEGHALTMVYLGGTDVVGHRFWRHRSPAGFSHPPAREQVENLGHVIDDYYRYVDGVVGRLVARAGENARILVVSDHGMHPVNLTQPFDPDDPPRDLNSGHHVGGIPGVVIAAGPGIVRAPERNLRTLTRDELPSDVSVMDVAPTVLALLGIPVGEDMLGAPAAALITAEFMAAHPVRRVPTHDDPAWLETQRSLTGGARGEDERLEQLRALGYLDAAPGQSDEAGETSSR